MTPQEIATGLLAVVMAMLGWWVRVMWEAHRELRVNLKEIERSLPETYVRRDDFKDLTSAIFEALRRIEDKLDGKADKL